MNARPPRLLFATDFSPWARGAELYACSLASSWGATLTVMSVLEFPPGLNPDYPVNHLYLGELMKAASEQLVDLRARVADRGLSVDTRITHGIPSEEVSAVAKKDAVELVIVGTKGKTGLEHVILGSTAERIIRTAPCPVLTVRGEEQSQAKGRGPDIPRSVQRLVVPLDFSDCSLAALDYAVVVAQRAKASIRLLHVLEPIFYGLDFTLVRPGKHEEFREAMATRLSSLASALPSGLMADIEVRGGLPAESILEAATTQSADLIVMGTHGRRGLSHVFWGSVAESVLRKAHCPVLTVRTSAVPLASGVSAPSSNP